MNNYINYKEISTFVLLVASQENYPCLKLV